MGYYTKYELKVDGEQSIVNAALQIIEQDNYMSGTINRCEPYKWYDHHKDMIAISKQFPSLLFTLHGVGEDFPDIWWKFYKNGKTYEKYLKIEWPEFDEKELK